MFATSRDRPGGGPGPGSSANGRSGRILIVLMAAVAIFGVMITADPAGAKVKVKNGSYYHGTPSETAYASLTTKGGKVIGSSFAVKLKNKAGKPCNIKGYETHAGLLTFSVSTKRVKTNRKNRYTTSSLASPFYPGFKATISGKFKSSKKATIKITATIGKCHGKAFYNHAIYVP